MDEPILVEKPGVSRAWWYERCEGDCLSVQAHWGGSLFEETWLIRLEHNMHNFVYASIEKKGCDTESSTTCSTLCVACSYCSRRWQQVGWKMFLRESRALTLRPWWWLALRKLPFRSLSGTLNYDQCRNYYRWHHLTNALA